MNGHLVGVALQRDGRVFLQPFSEMAGIADIADGLPAVLDAATDPEQIGEGLIRALWASNRRPLPLRDLREDPPDREFLAWLGVRSYGQYMRGVRSLSVEARFDETIAEVTITPERNGGPRDGFTPIVEERRTVTYENPEQLGRAVQEAMKKATA